MHLKIELNIPAIIRIQIISVYNEVTFKHLIWLLIYFVSVCLDRGWVEVNFYEPVSPC